MSKQEALVFFLILFVVWVLVNPAVVLLLGDEGMGYVELLLRVPQLFGALVGSLVGAIVMYVMKNKLLQDKQDK